MHNCWIHTLREQHILISHTQIQHSHWERTLRCRIPFTKIKSFAHGREISPWSIITELSLWSWCVFSFICSLKPLKKYVAIQTFIENKNIHSLSHFGKQDILLFYFFFLLLLTGFSGQLVMIGLDLGMLKLSCNCPDLVKLLWWLISYVLFKFLFYLEIINNCNKFTSS